MGYLAGGFQFPTSTGSHTFPLVNYDDGTPFTPQGMVFFGCDQSAMNTLITGAHGMYLGMAAPWWDDPSTFAMFCVSWYTNTGADHGAGKGMIGRAINQRGNSCGTGDSTDDHSAVVTSFDEGSFTINVLKAAPAFRWTQFWAWGEFEHSGARAVYNPNTTQLITPGWTPKCMISLLYHALSSGTDVCRFSHLYWGTDAYPGVPSPETEYGIFGIAGTSVVGIGDQGFTFRQVADQTPSQPTYLILCSVLDAVGPFVNLGSRQYYNDNGSQPSYTDLQFTGGGADHVEFQAFFDEGQHCPRYITPAQDSGDTASQNPRQIDPVDDRGNPYINDLGLCVFSHVNGDDYNGTGNAFRFGYGVTDGSYQGCVTCGEGVLYQSDDHAVADYVPGGGLLHTATGELSGDEIILTTDDDTATAKPVIAHMYGPGRQVGWMPQYSRWP